MSLFPAVTWLAVRELWISFRLITIITLFLLAGALLALIPGLETAAGGLVRDRARGRQHRRRWADRGRARRRAEARDGCLACFACVPRVTLLVGWFVALLGAAWPASCPARRWPGSRSCPPRRPRSARFVIGVLAVGSGSLPPGAGMLAGAWLPTRAGDPVHLLVCAAPQPVAGPPGCRSLSRPEGYFLLAEVPSGWPLGRALQSSASGWPRCAPADRGRAGPGARRPVSEISVEGPSVRMHPVAAWAALSPRRLGVLVGGAELMVVAIALPAIVADFGGWGDLARASWIVNAYLLAYLVAMPLAGEPPTCGARGASTSIALLLFARAASGRGWPGLPARSGASTG